MAFLHFLELQLTTERENIGETGKENVRECLGEDVRRREELVKGKGGWGNMSAVQVSGEPPPPPSPLKTFVSAQSRQFECLAIYLAYISPTQRGSNEAQL